MSPTLQEVVDAIRAAAAQLSRPPSRSEFRKLSGMTERHVLNHFSGWNNAVRAAGLAPHTGNVKLDDDVLLEDWGLLVRKHRQIPTREQYRRERNFSPGVFDRHFGPWSTIPTKFREYAREKPDWADVVTLLPMATNRSLPTNGVERSIAQNGRIRHTKLADRATYGNPIDFRGLRHEPVNEQGVIFLFGMVAKELGYLVEAVQIGYPDCEAKRQIGPNNWQRVRIEFEFESRNFREHGHPHDGCDVIVCWRHNWPDCPPQLEVLELSSVINYLSKSDD